MVGVYKCWLSPCSVWAHAFSIKKTKIINKNSRSFLIFNTVQILRRFQKFHSVSTDCSSDIDNSSTALECLQTCMNKQVITTVHL